MKNPNLLIQEAYSSHIFRKTMGAQKHLCQLSSIYIDQNKNVSLCKNSKVLGNLKHDLPEEILSKAAVVKKTFLTSPPQTKCCNLHLINLSLIEESYQNECHPIKELTVFSSLGTQLFASMLNLIGPGLKIIHFHLDNKNNLLDFACLFPNDASLRFLLDETMAEQQLIEFLEENKYFTTINCKKFFNLKIKNKNFIGINLEINDDNFQTVHLDYALFSQAEVSVGLNLSFTNKDNLPLFAGHIMKLESRYDAFFLKIYKYIESMEEMIFSSKQKQMLKLKWLNISHKSRQLCTIPFSEVAINADGSYRPCCWIGDYDLRDETTGNDINKVWNGKKIESLRNEFISGNINTCKKQMKEYSCNPTHGIGHFFSDYKIHSTRPMLKFHWFFNGSCNLECQMCTTWLQSKEFDESDVYLEQIKKDVLPYIGEIELVGGEPFYQKRTFALIEHMKSFNSVCIWNITSNGQFNFNGKIKNALEGLRLGIFSVSIDSLDPVVFSKIRKNGVLNQTLNFLEDLLTFKRSRPEGFQFDININFVIQKDNWTETERLILFAKEKGVNLYISPVSFAEQFSIYGLDEIEKIQCYQFLKMLYNKYHHPNLLTLINNLGKPLRENQRTDVNAGAILE